MPLTEREELELLELEEKEKSSSTPSSKIGMLEAGLRGVGQLGASGFGDELEASFKSPVGAAKKVGSRLGLVDGADPDIMNYMQKLTEARESNKQAVEQQPAAYYGAGGLSGLARKAATGVPGMMLEGLVQGYGSSDSDNPINQGLESSLGGLLGGVVGKAAKPVGKLFGAGLEKAGTAFKGVAENLARKSTGATGREAERFADSAGRELLDRGLVKFGSSPDDIARAANAANEGAEKAKGGILTSLDGQGGKGSISSHDIVDSLQNKIFTLRKDPGNGNVIRQLEKKIEDVQAGQELMSLAEADAIKRNFGRRGYKSLDPDANEAEKILEGVYRETIDSRASKISPELAGEFQAAKDTQSLLIPVQKASERRASTLNQSPLLGARDVIGSSAGAVAGGMIGGPIGALAGAATGGAVNRFVSPRLPAAGAVAADKAGDALNYVAQGIRDSGIPEQVAQRVSRTALGEYMLNLARNKPKEFLPKHYILMNTDPNYRKEYNGSDK